MILDIRTKFLKVLNNRHFFSWWQAFTPYRPYSSGLKVNVLTCDFIWNFIILYNTIGFLGDLRYWCYYLFRWHLFILWSYIFYFILILLWNLMSTDVLVHRSFIVGSTSWSTDVVVLRLFYFIYFVFISGVENKISSQTWQIYLPIFLLRVGLLTLVYIASFITLAIFCPSMPIILKLYTVV